MLTSQINNLYQGKFDIHAQRAGQSREWFHERIQDKDYLLITIGDSWTWGDSLGKIDIGNNVWDDYEHRVTHTYGYQLSNLLDTDWVNIGICGGCNLFILKEAQEFIKGIQKKKYKKITVIITLTELGRELLNDYRYDNSVTELRNTISDCKNLDELLVKYEAYIFNYIKNNFESFIIGRNFTHSYNENKSILGDNLLSKTWTEIIAEQGKLEPYPENIRMLSHMGVDPVLQFAKLLPKEQLINLIDKQELGFNWLATSPYNSSTGTKHPNEQAHYWWADYLYNYIKL